MFDCCNDNRIKDKFLSRDPTVNDTQIDAYSFVVNESTGDIFFKTKDANGNPKIAKLSGGGGGGGGVESLNGLTGALTITADPPLQVTPSGTSVKVTLTEKYVKTINGIAPTDSGDFIVDKTDPITITGGTSKITVGSTGGGGSSIQSISLNGEKIPVDSDGNISLQTENGIEGQVT